MTHITKDKIRLLQLTTLNAKTIKAIKEARHGEGKIFKTIKDLMVNLKIRD
jgi:hypothetical protein